MTIPSVVCMCVCVCVRTLFDEYAVAKSAEIWERNSADAQEGERVKLRTRVLSSLVKHGIPNRVCTCTCTHTHMCVCVCVCVCVSL